MYKILIVDDDYGIRLLYQAELEDEGYSVTTTDDCGSLLDQIEHLRPDVILLDVRVGDINGLDIFQEIRTRHYDLPIILCSAYDSFRHEGKAIGADYYVTKSIDLSELKVTIKAAFEKMRPWSLPAARIFCPA